MSKKIISLIALMAILNSCQKDDDELSPSMENDPVLNEKTLITTEETESNLIMIDSTKLVFQKGDSDIDNLKFGDILISDMTNEAPDGYLRKVIGVEENDNEITLFTEQATLTEAYEELHVDYSYTIGEADIELIDTSGIDITTRGAELVFRFDKILFDGDDNSSTKFDQIEVDGEINLLLEAELDWDISQSKLEYFKFYYDIINSYELNITAGGDIDNVDTEEIVLATFKLIPFTIPGTPIPIAKQWIVLVLDGSGKVKVELETSLNCSLSGGAGIEYNRGSGWSEIYDNSSNCAFEAPSLGGEVSAKTDLQFRYEIRPFGFRNSRIFLGIKAYGKAEITPEIGNPVIPWKLFWGIDLFGNAQMQIFNSTVINYEEELNLYEDIIAEGEFDLLSTFVDTRDGQEYQSIIIDGKRWLAEDLRYEGGQYDVGDVDGKCPNGWRIATQNDWEELSSFVISEYGEISALRIPEVDDCGGNNDSGIGLRSVYENTSINFGTSGMLYRMDRDVALWVGSSKIVTLRCGSDLFSYEEDFIIDNASLGFSCRCIEE